MFVLWPAEVLILWKEICTHPILEVLWEEWQIQKFAFNSYLIERIFRESAICGDFLD